MSNTLARNTKTERKTLFHANPVLRRMSQNAVTDSTDAATYAGIAAKTMFFLAMTLLGIVAQQMLMNAFASQPVLYTIGTENGAQFTFTVSKAEVIVLFAALVIGLVSELLGIFARKTVPVTGTLYSVSQGYVISFLVFKLLASRHLEYLGLEALLMTVAVVAVMAWLYTAGIIKVNQKFRAVLLALLLGSVGVGLLGFLGSLIPATRPYVTAMMENSAFAIVLDIIGIVIAALFLISDFDMVDTCVKKNYEKSYEWSAAFGLVFTVIWIYLKILDLLMQLNNKEN